MSDFKASAEYSSGAIPEELPTLDGCDIATNLNPKAGSADWKAQIETERAEAAGLCFRLVQCACGDVEVQVSDPSRSMQSGAELWAFFGVDHTRNGWG